MSFKTLKSRRKSALANIKKMYENQDKKKDYSDDRFWTPTKDAQGNATALIRFIPSKINENLLEGQEFVQYWSYGFKGPSGQWYIENSPRSLGEEYRDPVYEYNSFLYENGQEALAKKNKRKLNYVANIYVIKDPNAPENEGKVFLFKYGKQIADKIKNEMAPQTDEIQLDESDVQESVDVFDFYNGKSFKFVVKNKGTGDERWPTYEDSKFLTQGPLFKTDKELEEVYEQAYDVYEFIDPESDHYKSYDQLLERRNKVLGIKGVTDEASDNIEAQKKSPVHQKMDEDESPFVDDDSDDFDNVLKELAEEAEAETSN